MTDRRITAEQAEVLVEQTYVVTVGAPTVPVLIKWPDGTWHRLQVVG